MSAAPKVTQPAVPAFAVERSEMPGRVETPAPRPGVSTTRAALAALIIAATTACIPAALTPVFNSADMVCVAAPVALAMVLRRPYTPAGDARLPSPAGPSTHETAPQPQRSPGVW